MTGRRVDLVTLEVLRHRLDVIADEMEYALLRTSCSSIVKEALDASAALFLADGQMIAQATALPVHLGSLIPAVTRMLAAVPARELRDGDVMVMNDPYEGGTHIPDIVLLVPVRIAGETVGLACSLAHHQEIGGKTPGSVPVDATEIYQEGLLIPPMKLYHRGRLNRTLEQILRKNVRLPDILLGDMHAQVAAGRVGAQRLQAVFRDMGRARAEAYLRELLDRAEAITRQRLRRISDGEYAFEDYLDNDGIDLDRRITIRVRVAKKGSNLLVDFSGTDPQVKGPFNGVPSVGLAAVYFVVRAITGPNIPNNAGCYRMVELRLPRGSVLNPIPPAAVNSRAVTLRRVIDAVIGALVQAMPDRLPAASNGHPLFVSFGGTDPESGRPYVTTESGTGGMGARPIKDGIDVIQTDGSNAMNIPIEAVEMDYPLRVLHFRLRQDSGGPGRFRGGMGFEKAYEVRRGDVIVSHRGERYTTAPWGLFGGGPGAMARATIERRDGAREAIPSKLVYTLRQGDRVHFWTSGGGGYGDPLLRDPARVGEDIRNGKVSPEAARDAYGVMITPEGEVDREATARLRRELAGTRGPITWTYDRGPGLGRQPRWEEGRGRE
jgi:N-methylhydantoinase B